MTAAMARACRPAITRAAFAGSLLVHLLVIALLSLAAVRAPEQVLENLRVLDLRTITFRAPVVQVTPPAPPVSAPPRVAPAPLRPQPRVAQPVIAQHPAYQPAAHAAIPARPRPQPVYSAPPRTMPPRVAPSSPAGNPGGGGGPVNLGPGVPGGEATGGGGGTTPGTVPGQGSGSGSGVGPGTGSGSGGGHGDTPAPPPPPPPPAPEPKPPPRAPEPDRPPVRLADRATPEVVRKVAPRYPQECQDEGVEGTVSLLVEVLASGNVGKVSVTRSAGDSRLDAAAVAAVKRWEYRPAVQGGIPRTVMTRATVSFNLR